MQQMQRAMTAYGEASRTLPPLEQIVMLYDGAIGRLREAAAAIAEGRVQRRCAAVAKATAIVEGLHACLDREQGGEIAAGLDQIYTYVAFRLQRINLTNDVTICDELIERLAALRASWAAVLARSGERAGSPPAVIGTAAGPAELRLAVTA
jgi:flagellar protein FliS